MSILSLRVRCKSTTVGNTGKCTNMANSKGSGLGFRIQAQRQPTLSREGSHMYRANLQNPNCYFGVGYNLLVLLILFEYVYYALYTVCMPLCPSRAMPLLQ